MLGAMLLDDKVVPQVTAMVGPEDLTVPETRRVFSAILDLVSRGVAVDIMAVPDAMRRLGTLKVGDVAFVAQLTSETPSSANVGYYAEEVRKAAARRKLEATAHALEARTKDPTLTEEEIVAGAERDFQEVLQKARHRRIESEPIEEVMLSYFSGPQDEMVSSGFEILDSLLEGGFRMGGYTVVTGKTGSGKSTWISEVMIALLRAELRVWMGSFEMQPYRVGRTMMKQAGIMPVVENVEQFRNQVTHNGLFVSGSLGVLDPKAMADEMEYHLNERGVRHFVVDNLAVMESAESGERYEKQVALMQRILRFCLSNRVHFYLLAHLRKMAGNARPDTQDIAGAAIIGQLAENVLLLTRTDKEDYQSTLRILKSRTHGMGKAIRMAFDLRTERFFEKGLS